MHLTGDLHAQLLQTLLRLLRLGQAGSLTAPYQGARGDEEESRNDVEDHPSELVEASSAGGDAALQGEEVSAEQEEESYPGVPRWEEAPREEEDSKMGQEHVRGEGVRQGEQEEPAGEVGHHAPRGAEREEGDDGEGRDHEDEVDRARNTVAADAQHDVRRAGNGTDPHVDLSAGPAGADGLPGPGRACMSTQGCSHVVSNHWVPVFLAHDSKSAWRGLTGVGVMMPMIVYRSLLR